MSIDLCDDVAKVNSEINPKMNIIIELLSKYRIDIEDVRHIMRQTVHTDQELLNAIGEHIISSGGKMVRPLLTILMSRIFQYTGNKHILLAAAVEFIHASTLLHDDVIDNSLMRRFHKSANAIWGDKASILVGDFLFSQAFELMVRTNSISALNVLARASGIISKGEIAQLDKVKSKNMLSEQEYYNIITSKTAELFGAACSVGAVIANQNNDSINSSYNFGILFGKIYQIQDDLLDYSSSECRLGKPAANDFFEGKITLPIIILHRLATEEEKHFISSAFLSDIRNEKDFYSITAMIDYYDVESHISSIVSEINDRASQVVAEMHITESDKQILFSILDYASSRIS
jgi:octaprenyl-diphosphate synthase